MQLNQNQTESLNNRSKVANDKRVKDAVTQVVNASGKSARGCSALQSSWLGECPHKNQRPQPIHSKVLFKQLEDAL
ncbi:hypothetical protein LZ31DRAFT_549475 [Colletotrichum somersetense]|nr:hypothetical protein LZ31DRAFT_549475 [Colletotrichum somersetense]